MTERKHSELPWTVITDGETLKIKWFNGGSIANAMFTNLNRERLPAEANAAFIVTACNAHYDLVEALEEMISKLEIAARLECSEPFDIEKLPLVKKGRTALSKARGDA